MNVSRRNTWITVEAICGTDDDDVITLPLHEMVAPELELALLLDDHETLFAYKQIIEHYAVHQQ